MKVGLYLNQAFTQRLRVDHAVVTRPVPPPAVTSEAMEVKLLLKCTCLCISLPLVVRSQAPRAWSSPAGLVAVALVGQSSARSQWYDGGPDQQ